MKRFLGVLFLWSLASTDPAFAMNSDERLLFANGLYRRALYDLAIPEFQALRDDPAATNLQDLATFRMGECQRLLGKTNEAASSYDIVVAQYPQSHFAHRAAFRRAELDWLAGRQKDAMQKFQRLVALKPEADIEAASLYHLGLCQIGIDRTGEAELSFRRLIETHPESPYTDYARLALADIILLSNPTSDEASSLLMSITDSPSTPGLGAEALAKAALLRYRANDYNDAARLFSDLAARFPESEWTAKSRLESGWSHTLAGQLEAARTITQQGLSSAEKKDKPAWLYLMANIERRAEKFAAAAAIYDDLLNLDPTNELASTAAFEACGVAWQEKNYQRVIALMDRARGPADRDLSLRWMEAGAHQALGDQTKAAEAYASIVRDHPSSDRAPSAAYQLALIADARGESTAAAAAFAAIATNYSRHTIAADALMASAAAWLKAGNTKEAASTWTTLIESHPTYAAIDEAHMGRARAGIELEQNKQAVSSLDSVIAASTNRRFLAEAHYLRGTMFEKEEAFAKAEEHYNLALAQDPAASLARQIQFRRVAVLQRQDRNDEAAGLMNTLIAEGTGHQLPPTLLEWLARWNLEKKLYAEAETSALLLAVQGDTPGWKLLGYFIAGTAARALDKTDAAISSFEQAAAIDLNAREHAEALYQLGQLALETKRPAEAIAYFTRSAERAGTDTMMDIRARCYLQLGIAHEALEQWSDASRFYLGVGVLFDDPMLTPESLFRAAGALDAQQQTTQRDRVIAELKERFPDTEWSRKAVDRWP